MKFHNKTNAVATTALVLLFLESIHNSSRTTIFRKGT